MADATNCRCSCGGNYVVGLVLMILGCVLLVDKLDVLNVGELTRFWPLALVVAGTYLLIEETGRRR